MPYISDTEKRLVQAEGPSTSGELNYVLTEICIQYCLKNGISYQRFNDVLGALSGAQLEFYRRILAPYEEVKINKNGDVYSELSRHLPHIPKE